MASEATMLVVLDLNPLDENLLLSLLDSIVLYNAKKRNRACKSKG